MGKVIKVL